MSKFDGILSVKPMQGIEQETKTSEKDVNKPKTGNSKLIGKRSHPDYTQITAYLRKDTHGKVMRKIYKKQEFSELVEQLLIDWLRNAK